MDKKHVEDLVSGYLSGTATEQEKTELLSWYRSVGDEPLDWELEEGESEESTRLRILENIDLTEEQAADQNRKIKRIWPGYIAAAMVLLAVAFGLFFYTNNPDEAVLSKAEPEMKAPADFAPGSNKALLTLADGSTIVLDDSKTGLLAQQGITRVNKEADGKLSYQVNNSAGNDGTGNILYNTVSTPVGGKYQLSLPDGSKVWLNSASSLKFPAAFQGSSREVELQGEAYFEVAKRSGATFKVRSGAHAVEVLGTQFNINAYTNEPAVKTTLLEGSVKVSNTGTPAARVLKPGEQSQWNDKGLKVRQVDPQIATAWKEGYFRFENADIKTVMRQLSRWYGVKVRSEGKLPPQRYGGAIDMNLSLKQVLEILENGNVNFKLEGDELVVMP